MVLIQKQSWKIMKSKSQQLRFACSVVGKYHKIIFLQNDVFSHGNESHGIKSVKITWKNKQTNTSQ